MKIRRGVRRWFYVTHARTAAVSTYEFHYCCVTRLKGSIVWQRSGCRQQVSQEWVKRNELCWEIRSFVLWHHVHMSFCWRLLCVVCWIADTGCCSSLRAVWNTWLCGVYLYISGVKQRKWKLKGNGNFEEMSAKPNKKLMAEIAWWVRVKWPLACFSRGCVCQT